VTGSFAPVAVSIEFDDPEFEASVRDGLNSVELALVKAVQSDDAFINEAARHLVDAGGKRFRPLLTLLAAHFGRADSDDVIMAAVVCELTHLATLYHDDVMDEAAVRRGAQSANSRWGNSVAILVGDFLFARASDILADLGPEAVRTQARCFERLVSGQIRETVGAAPGRDPIEHYLGVLGEKTGSLIAVSAEFGGRFAGLPADQIAALRSYGEHIGVAFQISDDILDIASEVGQSGKTPGTDLREGVHTLPTLYALQDTRPAGARLRELVGRPLTDEADQAEALMLLRSSDALERARETTRRYADAARRALFGLPDVPARGALEALTNLVVDRTG
jgi:heptaprenyl diphosphate synthase